MPQAPDRARRLRRSHRLAQAQRVARVRKMFPAADPSLPRRSLPVACKTAVFLIERGGDIVSYCVVHRSTCDPAATRRWCARHEYSRRSLGSAVPHPQFYAVCDDPSVIGACFYLMEPLEGFAPSQQLPGDYANDPVWRRAMGEAARAWRRSIGGGRLQSRRTRRYGQAGRLARTPSRALALAARRLSVDAELRWRASARRCGGEAGSPITCRKTSASASFTATFSSRT